jgi:hypothetical protein
MISIFLRCPTVLARRNPTAGNGIFGCRDRRLKSAGETASVTGDRKSGTIPAKIPTETAHFDSGWKSAVWKDWMVVEAVCRNRSPCQIPSEQGRYQGNSLIYSIFHPSNRRNAHPIGLSLRFISKTISEGASGHQGTTCPDQGNDGLTTKCAKPFGERGFTVKQFSESARLAYECLESATITVT